LSKFPSGDDLSEGGGKTERYARRWETVGMKARCRKREMAIW
jgi:hypothetical protein